MDAGKYDLSLAQQRILRGVDLLDLGNHITLPIYLIPISEHSAHLFVLSVRKPGPFAGAALHKHLMSVLDDILHLAGSENDPVLFFLDVL